MYMCIYEFGELQSKNIYTSILIDSGTSIEVYRYSSQIDCMKGSYFSYIDHLNGPK